MEQSAEQRAAALSAAGVTEASLPVSVSSLGGSVANPANLPIEPNLKTQYNSATSGAITGAMTPPATFTTPSGAVVDANGNIVTPAKQDSTSTTGATPPANTDTPPWYQQLVDLVKGSQNKPTSSVDTYRRLAEENNLAGNTKDVNDLSAQLNAITASTTASQLGLETQDVRRSAPVLDRMQGQIARENAIKSLPIAAALNAAQGRLASAKENINTLLTLTEKDNEAKYKFDSDNIAYAFKFADIAQKEELQKRQEKIDKEKAKTDDFNKLKQSYVNAAVDAGDFKTAGKLATATDETQLTTLISGTTAKTKLDAGIVGEYQYATSQGYKGTFTQYQNEDANRKAVIARAGVAQPIPTSQDITNPKTVKDLGTINQINNVLDDANFADAFGFKGRIQAYIPGSPAQKVRADVQQVIDILALAARGELKGQGAVSDFEGQMLKNAQTALNFNLSAEDAKQALRQVRGAITTSSGGSANVKITDKNGVSKIGQANSKSITEAISQGFKVTYQ